MNEDFVVLNKKNEQLRNKCNVLVNKFNEEKNKWRNTLLLSIFLGTFGADRFYTGRWQLGLLKFLSTGIYVGIGWWIIDIIFILTKKMKNSKGEIIQQLSAKEEEDYMTKIKQIKKEISLNDGKIQKLTNDLISGKVDLKLNRVQTNLNLMKNENVYLKLNVNLSEPRSIREYHGGTAGTNVKVLGKNFRVGGFKGHSTSELEMTQIDSGKIYISNKRIVYVGNMKNYDLEYKKISNIEYFSDGIQISIKSRQKPLLFSYDYNAENIQIPIMIKKFLSQK